MLSTLLAVATIDRLGRRVGLWWGAVGQGISLILAGVFARLLKDDIGRICGSIISYHLENRNRSSTS